jgi:hypothetical protein
LTNEIINKIKFYLEKNGTKEQRESQNNKITNYISTDAIVGKEGSTSI